MRSFSRRGSCASQTWSRRWPRTGPIVQDSGSRRRWRRSSRDAASSTTRRPSMPACACSANGATSCPRKSFVLGQDCLARPLQVVELAALERVPEQRADQEYERDGERDEEVEAFHEDGSAPGGCRRMALRTTMKELAAMPMAASQ